METLEPTATHLPVLQEIFKTRKIKDVLEFGCGMFSTKFFVESGCNVTSIEMQHKEWFDKVSAEFPDIKLYLALGPMAWKGIKLFRRYDLIFVDGHGDSRPDCMMWAKDHTDLIIAHDTEDGYYKWERADMSGFDKKLYDSLTPTTTVWVRQ